MSVFNKLWTAVSGKTARTDAEAADRRLHARFSLTKIPLARLVLANGTAGTVLDISYSGAACRFPADVVLAAHMPARLFVLESSVEVIVTPVRDPAQPRDGHVMVGIHLLHQKPDSLLFLRDLIEPIRSGQTVTRIPEDMRKDQYRTGEWECLRGEGPVDFIIRSEAGAVSEALLTFAVEGAYAELIYKHGAVWTGRSTGGSGTIPVGASMAQTVTLDVAMARRAIFILLGMPAEFATLVDPVLTPTVEAIKKGGRVAAA